MPTLSEQVVLQVEDDGPGIAVSERDAVFGHFYRGATSEGHDGSGFGLAVVQEIARLHGSAVAPSDIPGRGLIVSVYLALALSEEHPAWTVVAVRQHGIRGVRTVGLRRVPFA